MGVQACAVVNARGRVTTVMYVVGNSVVGDSYGRGQSGAGLLPSQ